MIIKYISHLILVFELEVIYIEYDVFQLLLGEVQEVVDELYYWVLLLPEVVLVHYWVDC